MRLGSLKALEAVDSATPACCATCVKVGDMGDTVTNIAQHCQPLPGYWRYRPRAFSSSFLLIEDRPLMLRFFASL